MLKKRLGTSCDLEDTNNEEFDSENLATEESTWQVSDFESSDDDFEKDWTKLEVDCFNDSFENMKTQKCQ